MKRLILPLMLLLLCAACAQAQGLPREARALHEARYPGYAVTALDGYDADGRGQWALALEKDGHTALMLIEKEAGSAYAVTLDNPYALPDAGEAHFCPAGKIALALTQPDAGGMMRHLTITLSPDASCRWEIESDRQDGGVWANVVSTFTDMSGAENLVYFSNVLEGDPSLCFMRHTESKDGMPLATALYPRIPVCGEAAQMHRLDRFRAKDYPPTPLSLSRVNLAEYAAPWVPAQHTLRQLCVKPDQLILITQNKEAARSMLIVPWENNQYRSMQLASSLPKGASMDVFHMGDDELLISWTDGTQDFVAGFSAEDGAQWRLRTLMTGSDVLSITCDSVTDQPLLRRNDGTFYGLHPWQTLTGLNFAALPASLEEAVGMLERRSYAVVSNPDPADRLHLRERPDRSARSLGKFYNRTPVRILDINGEWAHVSIGSDGHLTGYMMTRYLAFDDDMDRIACVFPQLELMEHIDSAPLALPGGGSGADIADGRKYFIIGIQDENYIILTVDGETGYLESHLFWPGNG